MNRASTLALLSAIVASAAALGSCYKTYNKCAPTLPCPGGRCLQGSECAKGPVDPTQALYKLRPGEVPNAFYVAVDKTGACADLTAANGRWLGRPLLPYPPSGAQCGYVWRSDTFAAPDPGLVRGLEAAEVDPPAIASQQAAGAQPIRAEDPATELAARYKVVRERLGEPAESERRPHSGRIRVAVVDSASSMDDAGDNAAHGVAVGRLIEDVACKGQQPCGVEVQHYAALPLSTSATGYLQVHASGVGAYGTRGHMAEQIQLATQTWLADRGRGAGPEHLVINLSLGWSGCWNRPNAAPLSDPVYRAIARASCQGALVVAAGGNIEAVAGCPAGSNRRDRGEHVFPAQFLNKSAAGEQRTSPQLCRAVGIEPAKGQKLGPLVLGISAVDNVDNQLTVADQESSLVAYGGAVVVPHNEGWTRLLSGTSMSAATVSGIAAAVWATVPALSVADVERALIEPAVALGPRPGNQPTFLCNTQEKPLAPHECEHVRRASLCRSLAHAAGVSSECGPPSSRTPASAAPPATTLAEPAPSAEPAADCSKPEVRKEWCPPPPANAIDSMEQPWAVVATQPGGNSCGTCRFYNGLNVFSANLATGTATNTRPGWVHFPSGDYGLWSNPTLSTPNWVAASIVANPSSGTLWYIKDTNSGPIYYYEYVYIDP